jgi:hypothetical protein
MPRVFVIFLGSSNKCRYNAWNWAITSCFRILRISCNIFRIYKIWATNSVVKQAQHPARFCSLFRRVLPTDASSWTASFRLINTRGYVLPKPWKPPAKLQDVTTQKIQRLNTHTRRPQCHGHSALTPYTVPPAPRGAATSGRTSPFLTSGCATHKMTACSVRDTTVCSVRETAVCSVRDTTVCSVRDTTVCSVRETTVCSVRETTACSVRDTTVCSVRETTVCSVRETTVCSVQETAVCSVREKAVCSVRETTVCSVRETTVCSVRQTAVCSVRETAVCSVRETTNTTTAGCSLQSFRLLELPDPLIFKWELKIEISATRWISYFKEFTAGCTHNFGLAVPCCFS